MIRLQTLIVHLLWACSIVVVAALGAVIVRNITDSLELAVLHEPAITVTR